MQTATFESMPQPLKDAYIRVTPNKEGLLNMFNKDKQRMIDFTDINDEAISSIKAPALFMVSYKDVITIEHTLAMAKLVAAGQLIVLPGAHGQFFGEMAIADNQNNTPKAAAILINEFLKI